MEVMGGARHSASSQPHGERRRGSPKHISPEGGGTGTKQAFWQCVLEGVTSTSGWGLIRKFLCKTSVNDIYIKYKLNYNFLF